MKMVYLYGGLFCLCIFCIGAIIVYVKLESNGIIISMRPFGERDVVARIFTEKYGVLSGMLRGASGNIKTKPLVGQVGTVSWNARLESQLGVFHFELQKNLALSAMMNNLKLTLLNSMFSLIETLLSERESYLNLYNMTLTTLENINMDSYLQWELFLLRDLGYALDLSHCSGCGKIDNLIYLSPRTGRAVCADCGKPYVDKLFDLPINLQTSLWFLKNVCAQQDVVVPDFRIFLHNM